MAKNSIRDYSATVGNNTDIQSVNIDEGCSPAGINNAIREMMVDLANVNSGAVSLVSPDFDTATIGGTAIDSFPSGTKMLFNQTAAPTGWTKDTTHNDKALRITNGTVGTGGTVAFETALSSQSVGGTVTVAEHTLTIAEMPSHTHTLNYDFVLGITDSSRTTSPPTADGGFGSVADQPEWTASNTGGGDGHSHGATFSGTAIDLDVQYVDVIIASKD
jgi:hypothetical protein